MFADLAKAFGDRPAEVKAAIGRLFPTLTPESIEIFYGPELAGFMAKPLTPADIAHEIEYVKLSGSSLPNLDLIVPATVLYP